MESAKIRQSWLDFFNSKDHLIVETKNLIPVKDNSLLWINSGVATLKDYFSGKKKPIKPRLANSQKAIRTNDIENVGITTRHHTFFEMLGNFSIGDYFKKEAIAYACEYLKDVLKLDFTKLYVTYFYQDKDTYDLWVENGIDPSHMVKGDRNTNFWEVGSGPCGPNTEIFYDRGTKYDQRGIELLEQDIDNDRFIEIWNIVFSTYNSDGEGKYTELKQKNIDTGAGLERIAAIMQDVPTNYDTDLFLPIIHEIEKMTPYNYKIDNYFVKDQEQAKINTAFKIIADHMRTAVNAIGDGAKVSNVGRGYIIRRLIRRSYYQSFILKIKEKTFLHKLVAIIKKILPFEYNQKLVADVIEKEEKLFAKTIEKGRKLLESLIAKNEKIDANLVFKLYETYGFPFELTIEILKENNIIVSLKELEKAQQRHANKSRTKQISGMKKVINSLASINSLISKFVGYDVTENKTKIVFLANDEKEVDKAFGKSYVILKETPFYATSGGQNHDHGYMMQKQQIIKVLDVFKDKNNNHIHLVEGNIEKTLPVECFVDQDIRLSMARNHSSTHIMFSIMRRIISQEIKQLGSDITQDRFTFDFPSDNKLTEQQIMEIENQFDNFINLKAPRSYNILSLEKAKQAGAYMTLEEIEYMDPRAVRMVEFKNITKDLCGGTHVENTSIIEAFKITSVEKKAAGIYRIRAVTSKHLVNEFLKTTFNKIQQENEQIMLKINNIKPNYKFKKFVEKDLNKLINLYKEYNKFLIQELKSISKEQIKSQDVDFTFEEISIKNKNVIISFDVPNTILKIQAASYREKNHNNVVVFGAKIDNDILLSVASHKVDSNKLIQSIFKQTNGKGGGNNIFAIGKSEFPKDLRDIIFKAIEHA